MSGGPVQLMVFGYGPGEDVEAAILAELDALEGKGLLRLLDFLFVHKTRDGELEMLDVGDDDDYGTILQGFFDWEGTDSAGDADAEDELAELAASLDRGTSMVVVLVEHLWAGGLFDAVGESGGELLSEGFITEEGAVVLGAEVDAVSEAALVIESAHEAEAAARLEALIAIGEAATAVEAAEAIRTAAAAEAVNALIAAGIIEQHAADEAADALAEAGLIISAAEDAETEAVAEAGSVISAARDAEIDAVEEADSVIAAAEQVEDEAVEQAADVVAATQAVEDEAVGEAEVVRFEAGLAEVAAIDEAEEAEELAARVEAASEITAAEKRLLRYLGTGLTFAMIADKMHVSRGAVKARAARVYEKLGVHNRDDAVASAVELGVIKG